jgi:hypothetical protein
LSKVHCIEKVRFSENLIQTIDLAKKKIQNSLFKNFENAFKREGENSEVIISFLQNESSQP